MGFDRLTEDYIETIAQAIHEAYRQDMEGKNDPQSSSMAPWNELEETLKGSNRDAARHMLEKVEVIGCEVREAGGTLPVVMELTEDEVERLAEMEHERWVEERERDGWRYSEVKDVEKKLSPYMVPWEEITDEVREWDRNQVRRIPEFLASVGLEIVRK